jgi:hypothetical protein
LNEEFDNGDKRKKSKSSDADDLREIADALPELFKAINDSVPKLIQGLIGSVYSPEAAGNMGAAVGKFYRELIDQGIPEEVALDMTKKFVGALDFSKLMSAVSSEIESDRESKPKPPKPPGVRDRDRDRERDRLRETDRRKPTDVEEEDDEEYE